jgi:endonuclease-8
MPEGDTVWLTARRLREALAGRTVVRCDLRVPKLATTDFSGRRIEEVLSRGKHLLTRFEGGWTLHSHLRMDGSWQVYAAGERWRGGPHHQIRAVLATAESVAVGYRLPVLELLRTAEEDCAVGHLGPDLLGPDWDPGEALCFLRGVTPWTPVGQLTAPERMVALAHKLLDANKARHGHITTGNPRRGRTHWVYNREHQPCLRCGTAVRRADQGPSDEARVTYWCPNCQKGPSPHGG